MSASHKGAEGGPGNGATSRGRRGRGRGHGNGRGRGRGRRRGRGRDAGHKRRRGGRAQSSQPPGSDLEAVTSPSPALGDPKPVSEEIREELEALEAIYGDEFESKSDRSFRVRLIGRKTRKDNSCTHTRFASPSRM